jgi:hypothetical protein
VQRSKNQRSGSIQRCRRKSAIHSDSCPGSRHPHRQQLCGAAPNNDRRQLFAGVCPSRERCRGDPTRARRGNAGAQLRRPILPIPAAGASRARRPYADNPLNLCRICIALSSRFAMTMADWAVGGWGEFTMSARFRKSFSSAAFVCALLVPSLGASAPADAQKPSTCLSAPTSLAPQNSHWYYRTNRTTQLKCWHLATNDQASPTSGGQTGRDGATSKPFRSSHANLSEKETAKLYAEFLEWKDRQAGKR